MSESNARQRSVLAAALTIAGLFLVVPIACAFWGFAALLALALGANGLDQTDGLVGDTYDLGFNLAGVLVGLTILISSSALWRRRNGATNRLNWVLSKPTLFLCALLVVPTAVLVPIDLNGSDVPDVITTTLILGLVATAIFFLPGTIIVNLVKATRVFWRWTCRTAFRTGLVAGLCSVMGLWGLSTILLVATDDGLAIPNLVLDLGSLDLEDDSHDLFVGIATYDEHQSADVERRDSLGESQRRFGECLEELAAGEPPTLRDRGIRFLVSSRATNPTTAEDVVSTTFLNVCENHMKEPIRKLDQYFWRALKNESAKAFNRESRHECLFDYERQGWESEPQLDELIDTRRRFCRLDPADAHLLQLQAEGYKGPEIAKILGISAVATRQRISRASRSFMQH